MRASLALATASLVVAALTAACSSGFASTGAAGLVSDRCTRCHPVDRIKSANHDAAGWEATVTRMRNAHGARLSDTEAQEVIEFLAGGGASQL